jgi:hypothetical protein
VLALRGDFQPRRRGHVFCSSRCRHRGARKPEDRLVVDHEQLARLFDESRDPNDQVRDDDWHPTPETPWGLKWRELDAVQTVGQRRQWYLNLMSSRPGAE